MEPHHQQHYFTFSALESFWENTNHLAQSFTYNNAPGTMNSPKSPKTMAKPPLSPRGSGRPPLSPTTLRSWEESVETVMSPRSIDDVRLFMVRDLEDIPDLYENYAQSETQKNQQQQPQPILPNLDEDVPSETNSLDFTQGTSSTLEATPRSVDEVVSFADASSADGEELLGLFLLEQTQQQHHHHQQQQQGEEEPSIELDLDFLKQDPPKAHVRRGLHYMK